MQSEVFLSPRLTGARFEQHAIPLEVLRDLAALEEMLVEVAKWRYKEAHPERSQLPRRFGQEIALKLSSIEKGSAITKILLCFVTLLPPAETRYFNEAKEAVVQAVADAEQGRVPKLPSSLLGYFDRIGRSLRPDEAFEFTAADSSVARLTSVTRQQLLASSGIEEWSEEAVLRGLIPKADQEKMNFEMTLADGSRVKCSNLPPQHLETVLEAFAGWRQACKVQIQATIRKDRKGKIKAISELEHIAILDPLDITERLLELAALEDGWMDGKGRKLDGEALAKLAEDFERFFDPTLPLPTLFPTLEGGIQAEWWASGWAVTLEIDLGTLQADFTGQQLISPPKYTDELLDLKSRTAWEELNQLLQVLKEAQA